MSRGAAPRLQPWYVHEVVITPDTIPQASGLALSLARFSRARPGDVHALSSVIPGKKKNATPTCVFFADRCRFTTNFHAISL
jgi:hypothetical protein